MYTPAPPPPTREELAQYGLTAEQAAPPPFEIWPDNFQAYIVFDAMYRQWRTGMNGPTGLDYSALPEVWRRTKTPPADRDSVFYDMRVMEEAALGWMHTQQARAAKKDK